MTVPLLPPTNPLLLRLTVTCRHITTRKSLGGGHFFDEGDRKGNRNVILIAIHPPDTADNPKIFY